ncbi:MAG TPA: DUF4157 domain-containing protein, partial [Pedobacter sp.]
MNTHADKIPENINGAAAHSLSKQHGEPHLQFEDKRPEAVAQRKLHEIINNSRQVKQFKAVQEMADSHQKSVPVQQMENRTGLPDRLKSGVENLSGLSMDDVKVHYNSGRPAQLQAHAYAQGTDIHIASGQEKHLPHEVWHVVQQKQGRVKPTVQFKGANINDSNQLEKEADIMGQRSLRGAAPVVQRVVESGYSYSVIQMAREIGDIFNFIDQNRDELGEVGGIAMKRLLYWNAQD